MISILYRVGAPGALRNEGATTALHHTWGIRVWIRLVEKRKSSRRLYITMVTQCVNLVLIRIIVVGIKWMSNHQYLQIFGLKVSSKVSMDFMLYAITFFEYFIWRLHAPLANIGANNPLVQVWISLISTLLFRNVIICSFPYHAHVVKLCLLVTYFDT